jgi:hypothetical protein
MDEETKIKLQYHYVELIQKLKTSNDYFERKIIKKKMKAIECLLDCEFV